jgi:uncharacterized SAM-binding protein YcdF (DUF218 family)
MFIRAFVADLVSPLGTALLLALLAAVLTLAGRSRASWRGAARWVAGLAVGWLWLWSTPVASHALRAWLEAQAGPAAVQDVPAAPVIVVLGDGIRGPRAPERPYPDLTQAADRVWHAARLYHAGKAPWVLVSGGTVRPVDVSEAQSMQIFLQDLGVPATAVIQEPDSLNTGTNALHTARLLRVRGVDRVILVTSALHMRRARLEFEAQGLQVHPAPADFEALWRRHDARDWLPRAEALEGSARAFKECLGYLAAR